MHCVMHSHFLEIKHAINFVTGFGKTLFCNKGFVCVDGAL
jgi:hypothetical protein